MQKPPVPEDEAQRLAALEQTGLLDTPPEQRFDRITRVAQSLFGVEIVLVSLVAESIQWFKSRQGLDACETGRDISFCGHAILGDSTLVVEDASQDPRFSDNPLVTGAPFIRFYAGAPLRAPGGYRIGTLCLIDSAPRQFGTAELALLRDLADLVEQEVASQDVSRQLARAELAERRLASVIKGTHIGTWEWNVQTGEAIFNERWAEIIGYTLSELEPITIETWLSRAHPDDLKVSGEALEEHFQGKADYYDVVCRMKHRDGHWVWVHDRGQVLSWTEDGKPRWMAGTHADVTAEVAARDALKTREQQYRSLVDNIPGVTYRCLLDEHWTMLYMSDKVDPLSGYPPSDFINNAVRSYQSVIHPEDRAHCDQEVNRALAAGKPWQIEYRVMHRDGTVRWAEERGSPVWGDAGNVLYLDGFILDITEQKQAADLVSYQRALYETILEGSLAGYWDWSLAEGTEYLSPTFKRMFGYGDEEMENSPEAWQKIVFSEDLPRILANFDAHVNSRGREPFDQEVRYHHRNGATVWVRCTGRVIEWDGEGRPVRMVGSHVDITQSKSDQKLLQGLFELSPIGIGLNDFATGAFVDANAALLASAGYTKEEFLKLSYWQLTPAEYEPQELIQLESLKATGRYGPFEKEYIRKDGSRYPVLLNGMLVQDNAGRQLIWSIIQDISERKRVERLQNEFISTVSHELRTPLTAIRGSLGLLQSGATGGLPETADNMVALAAKNCERLSLLINDLLDMEKLLAGKMQFDFEEVPLSMLLSAAVAETEHYATQYGVKLVLEQPAQDAQVRVDKARFQQVMANLISNAVKFSPPDGVVRIAGSSGARRVCVAVQDQGPGIPDVFRGRIFQKFAQADASDSKSKGGTGLGLAITKELVEQMAGRVDFESQPGQGTTFFVWLPLAGIQEVMQ
ncbi:MAG: PAS domain-containing protein [Marinobacter sp.]|nr:PAS domain-containing protein [Marinobacter sp.]